MGKQTVLMTAVGSYLPANVVTNNDLSAYVDTSDEWIQRRTGIVQRHFVANGETTADLASIAATNALAQAGIAPTEIDLIIVATTTPDNTFPSTATKVQYQIGASGAIAFDVQAVCAGFIYAVDIADAMLRGGRGRRAVLRHAARSVPSKFSLSNLVYLFFEVLMASHQISSTPFPPYAFRFAFIYSSCLLQSINST